MNTIQKKNKRLSLKIGIIALVAVLTLGAVLVSFINRTTFVAYANTQQTVSATFLDVRTGTRGNPSASTFRSMDFQRSTNNFTTRFQNSTRGSSGIDIASLLDRGPCGSRTFSTLRHQSYQIRQQQYISTAPLLTVITHGQGGRASDWSNNGVGRFLYHNHNSLIERLRRESNANVYVARSYIYDLNYEQQYTAGGCPGAGQDIFRNPDIVRLTTGRNISRPLISLFPLEPTNDEYILNSYPNVYSAMRLPSNQQTTSAYTNFRTYYLRDKTRHNIIVFESRASLQYRNFVYNELNAILTMISYDFFRATGIIPLINMVGHSTGGIWNMMWANRHPHNVSRMFALGSPFDSSDIAYNT